VTDLLDDIDLPVVAPPLDLDALEHYANESKAHGLTHCAHPDILLSLIGELRTYRAGRARTVAHWADTSLNGHRVVHRAGQYPHICAGCGDEFTSNRRPVPGKRSWCGKPECKKQAAALRAEEYRKRKSKETQ
jgi:hypothetical protein